MATDNPKMDLAEAIVDASRSLDRTRRKIEALIEAFARIPGFAGTDQSVQQCRKGIVDIQQLNNNIRRMNT